MKLKFTNLAGNLGDDLIKSIYKTAYRLYATEVVVKNRKYERYAIVDLFAEDGAIALNYTIEV